MKMSPSRTAALLALALVAGLLAAGCPSGPNDSNQGNPSPTTGSNPPPTASAPAGGGTTPAGGVNQSTEVSMAVGDAVFKQRCELCHGASGLGDGVGGQALNPKPRNFHDKAYMSTLTDDQIFNTIMNGKAGTAMPPWKGIVSESEAKSLILKVRSFAK